MPKHCAILKCNTDRERLQRRKLGLKELTLFRIPKGENVLKTWSESIEQTLSATDYLCERHFPKQSIRKVYKTPMPDGTVHILARDRYGLIRGAIPNTNDNYDENDDIFVDNGIDSAEVVADNINDTSTQPDLENSYIQDEINIIFPEDTSIEDLREIDEHPQQEANCSMEPDLIEVINIVHLNKATGVKNKIEKSRQKVPEKPKPFTIGDVFPHLEGLVLPETWAWINNRYEESNTFLIQLKRDTMESRLRLIIHEDYSVTLCTADGQVHIKLHPRVTSISAMTELLGEVGRMMVCEGSGMEEERRAEDCSGIVGPHEYSTSVRILRCAACRHLRKTIQSRLSRLKTEFDAEFSQSKEELNLTRLSCRRLQRKIRTLKKKDL